MKKLSFLLALTLFISTGLFAATSSEPATKAGVTEIKAKVQDIKSLAGTTVKFSKSTALAMSYPIEFQTSCGTWVGNGADFANCSGSQLMAIQAALEQVCQQYPWVTEVLVEAC